MLLTLADWRLAVQAGAPWPDLLSARLARLREAAAPHAWIALATPAQLQARIAKLHSIAAGRPAAQVLRTHPLFGVPFAVKDNIDVAGWPTTAACPAWAETHEPASRHANAVRRLLDAGAVLLGKTNLDQFATGLVGTRSPYGAPESTLAPGRVSGGSSSGSAVVVARGDVPFALGTDTAGSGRVPAGFNNLVGLKPTTGRIGTSGVLPACRTLDCVSVFALTVEDAAAVLAVAEGPDDDDEYSAFAPGAAVLPAAPRVGIPKVAVLDAALGYDAAWQRTLALLHEAGATIVELDFAPLHDIARLLYEGPWVAERYHAALPLIERRPQDMDPTVAGILVGATRWSAAQTFAAQYTLQRGRKRAQALWQQVDMLMVPTAPRHPSFDEVAADPVGANAVLGSYTNFVNFLGWSALALPAGFTDETPARPALPFGVTFIGPGGADAALARFGRTWQRLPALRALPLGATARHIDDTVPESNGDAADAAIAMPWPASEATLPIAVVGAHLSGLPLNGQLVERGAVFAEATRTAARYRLFELPASQPPKPGLLRVAEGGGAIELEVWQMPQHALGSFLALIPPPLGLGPIELADGRHVHGFLCEAAALQGARDITAFGGWRAWLAGRHGAATGAVAA
ncbi:MAG: allophanate hydrolase [Rubrivivax sp.]|nr:allophanate hydrolase [Rubrivivax sp.]